MTKNANFNVRFMPRAMKNEEQNKERIYARVTIDGQRVEISTSQITTAGLFNTKAQRCLSTSKEARQVNDFLNLFNFKLNEIRQNLILSGFDVTSETVKRAYQGLPIVDEVPLPKLIELYTEHNKRMKSLIGIDITEATIERHLTSMNHIQQFILLNYKKDDLDFCEVDYHFILNYEHYLKTIRRCNHNTPMKYITNLGKIMLLAISE